MKKKFINFFIFLILLHAVKAQSPITYNSSDIYLKIKKLNVLGSVLYIAAHPDDENTRLLAYLSKEKMYRTGYLSLTRGDGGQNLIGNEQGVELGLIRTQELLSARRIDGAEQFFSRAYDFGFSKSADEAMRIWDKEKILSDVVWVIRNFQPDVIITRFPGDERAGHGHHAASSLLANEAFTAAADPKRFPEQLHYVKLWQAKRILWNTFNFGNTNTTAEDQFKIDVGGFNALLGKGYGEIAAESRSQHKSQGFGVAAQRGPAIEYFKTTGGSNPQKDLMDSVNTGWARVGYKKFTGDVSKIITGYSFEHPEKSLPELLALYHQLSQDTTPGWLCNKYKEVREIIEACCGLYIEGSTVQTFAVAGDSLHVAITINKRNECNVTIKDISLVQANETGGAVEGFKKIDKSLAVNENLNEKIDIKLDEATPVSQPYWLKFPMSAGSFTVNDLRLIGKAQSDPSYTIRVKMIVEGIDMQIDQPVQYKYTDPVRGELFQPLVIMPRLSVQEGQPLYVTGPGNQQKIKIRYTANAPSPNATINVHEGMLVNDTMPMSKGAERFFETMPGKRNQATGYGNEGLVKDTFDINNKPALYPVTIRYDHIPGITYFRPAVQSILNLDIKIAGKRIGYITGAGDKVIPALEQMGYEVIKLAETDISAAYLQQFDAVITGVRAYNVNAFMQGRYSELMAYVKNGGNLVVQYNTNSPLLSKIGPYPFTISRNRITDETAVVHFNLPDNSSFNFPNKITAKDFDGWIQERSIYQAEQIDSNYTTPISMADPGEKPSNGSLIIAKYGKGNFVYTGLVFFRELPAGVPGAYRLMANLIGLPKN